MKVRAHRTEWESREEEDAMIQSPIDSGCSGRAGQCWLLEGHIQKEYTHIYTTQEKRKKIILFIYFFTENKQITAK